MKPTLVVMAAGMGSRYGGLKQIEPIGPSGELIIEYSIHDAVKAGFGRVVFVIHRSFADNFKKVIANKLNYDIEIEYVYQELDSCIGDFQLPTNRQKPWGTAHAILVCREKVNTPFAVINADDFYGNHSFKLIGDFLINPDLQEDQYALIGYKLQNTLSDFGKVSRGLCSCDEDMLLQDIVETHGIAKDPAGAKYCDQNGQEHHLSGDKVVSMNFWGFHPSIFEFIESQFEEFLLEHGNEIKTEIYLPFVVDNLVKSGLVNVSVLTTTTQWFGITYKQDKPAVVESIKQLVEQGVYLPKLKN